MQRKRPSANPSRQSRPTPSSPRSSRSGREPSNSRKSSTRSQGSERTAPSRSGEEKPFRSRANAGSSEGKSSRRQPDDRPASAASSRRTFAESDRPKRAYRKQNEGQEETYNPGSSGHRTSGVNEGEGMRKRKSYTDTDRDARALRKQNEARRAGYKRQDEGHSPFEDREGAPPRRRSSQGDSGRPTRPYRKDGDSREGGYSRGTGSRRPSAEREDAPPRRRSSQGDSERPTRPYRRDGDSREGGYSHGTGSRRTFTGGDDAPPRRRSSQGDSERPTRPYRRDGESREGGYSRGTGSRRTFTGSDDEQPRRGYGARQASQPPRSKSTRDKGKPQGRGKSAEKPEGAIRLNKFLSNAGIASRREADELILAGAVMVNGIVVNELGVKVGPDDKVQYGGETIRREKLRYLLLNKPAGYITTTDDPFDRNTVMNLVQDACQERIYPVGRLDRKTTGLLLFTNDGDLAKKLTHPSHRIRKVYKVELDKALTRNDMMTITQGVELDDGMAFVDEIAYNEEGKSKKEVGVELHSGRNRIVRRIFEALGYEVLKLDRTVFAGLTKKDLPRGHWRMLSDKEISFLRM